MKCLIKESHSFDFSNPFCLDCSKLTICNAYYEHEESGTVDDDVTEQLIETEIPTTMQDLLTGILDIVTQSSERLEKIQSLLKLKLINN